MSRIAQQLSALALVVRRRAQRQSMRPGEAPTLRSIVPATAMWLVVTVVPALAFSTMGRTLGALKKNHDLVLRVDLWGVLLFGLCQGLLILSPVIGKIRPPLREALLDELPLHPLALHLADLWSQLPYFLAWPTLLVLGTPACLRSTTGIVEVAALGVGLTLVGNVVGRALAMLLRVHAARPAQRVISSLNLVLLIAPIMVIATAIASGPHLHAPWDPLLAVARVMEQGRVPFGIALELSGLGLVAIAVIAACELVGYDRVDSIVTRLKRGRALVSQRALELRLGWRDGSMRAALLVSLVSFAMAVGMTVLVWMADSPGTVKTVVPALAGGIALYGTIAQLTVARQAALRDVQSRALLQCLPLSPAQTLEGKASALRLIALPSLLAQVVTVLALLVRVSHIGVWPTLTLIARLGLLAVGVLALCDVATALAFLVYGEGAKQSPFSTSSMLTTLLLATPLATIALAPMLWQSVAALLMLLALSFESRRAAMKCLDWVDDSAEGIERDTPVWRAILVFSGFFGMQALAGLLLGLFDLHFLDAGLRMAVITGVSGAFLIVSTRRAEPDIGRLRLWPRTIGPLLLGLVGGAASGGLALGLVHLVGNLGHDDAPMLVSTVAGQVGLFVAVVIFAPLAEETFFRGWLQSAIERELPSARRWLAPVIGACAFAGIHFGTLLVPQLVLGLVAGVLYARTRTLAPGIIAHVVHNAIVLLLAG